MNEEKRKEKPLLVIILFLFIVTSICGVIGYKVKNPKIVVVEDDNNTSNTTKDPNDLGSSRTIVRIKYDYKNNFYGCYKSNCNKLDLDINNYNFDMKTEIEFDDNGQSGDKLKAYIEDGVLKFQQSNKIFSLPGFENPKYIHIMGDKKNGNHIIYVLSSEGVLTKIVDSEFIGLGQDKDKINTSIISEEPIDAFSASEYTSELEVPEIDLFLKGKNGTFVDVNNSLFDINSLVNLVKFNNDFMLLNINHDNSDDYNLLKYNNEILYVNSIFYNNDDIVVIDSNNNMYNIIKNKISKVEDKKVSEVKKEDDKIVVFFNTFETKEYDFVFDKAIYINNSMYVNFESKE